MSKRIFFHTKQVREVECVKKTVTIYEVAQESGVSPSTVSRVLNGNPHVSPETRDKVNAVIDKSQFTPSSIARAMSSNRTKTLGIVMPDIMNPYFSALFFEMERCALEHAYSVVLCNTLYGGSSHGVTSSISETEYLETLLQKRVDGVLVVGGQMDKEDVSPAYVEALNRLNQAVPVVVIGQPLFECDCLFVSRDLGGGVSALVQHLAALGHKRIGFVGGEVGVKQTTARLNAYKEAMDSLGLSYHQNDIALTNFYIKDGYNAMMSVLGRATPRPGAIIAINDMVAMGAIRAARDCGIKVPEDIAMVSCDQFLESDFTVPRLTSLDQQNEYIGRLSVMMLLGAIGGVKERVNIDHKPRLIIRESCGSQLYRRRS